MNSKPTRLHKHHRVLRMIACGIILLFPVVAMSTDVINTKHNLSSGGRYQVKAQTETQICIFCHTPHMSISQVAGLSVPLWNHSLSNAAYTLFSSPTLKSPTSPQIQPDGDSKLCLSCHDGTVAIGAVVNTGGSPNTISMTGTGVGGVMPGTPGGPDSANMGTDISGHHPVSIEVNATLVSDKNIQCNNGEVSFRVCAPPLAPVKLVRTRNTYPFTGQSATARMGVQCTSCHDPHNDPSPPPPGDPTNPNRTVFLRVGTKTLWDNLCLTCHLDCNVACP